MPRVAIYARTIRNLLVAGTGIREMARRTGAGTVSVMRIKQTLEAQAA